jgi:hypothetical protein
MTAEVKDELARLVVTSAGARRAEVSSLLRFCGGLRIVGGGVIVEAELDLGATVRRLRKDIFELFGHNAIVNTRPASGTSTATGYVLRVTNGEALARRTGLLDTRGRPVDALAPHLVTDAAGDAEAIWRGAFLARGSLAGPGHCPALKVTCPGPQTALALVSAAHRLGVHANARGLRGGDHVVVRNGEAICALLGRMGAQNTRLAFEQTRMRHKGAGQPAAANRLANLHGANLRRSAAAAPATITRIKHALQTLGDTVPDHLASAAKLRIEHQHASLQELGRLADPPMTKDTVAGRIRRLLAMAGRKTTHDDIPGAESAVACELLR